MRRLRLSAILVVVNVGLVAVAIVCVAQAASIRLRRLADDQVVARVRLAGLAALHAVDRSGDDVLAAARLLAERPTLRRLLLERDPDGAARFLERFRETGRLSACSVRTRDGLVAQSGRPLDWSRLTAGEPPDLSIARPGPGEPLVAVASAPVEAVPGAVTLAALVLDAAYARDIADQVGMPVRILDVDEALGDFENPRTALRSRALDSGAPAAAHLEAAGVYLAVFPLGAGAGAPVGVLEASLERAGTAAAVRRLQRSIVTLALIVAAGATAASVVIARRLARPLRDLTGAAARIGAGDLATPIPRPAGFEAGILAGAMEQMRARLLHLTGELRRRQGEAEAILTGIVEGVFAVDRERRIRYLNPQAAALLGLARDEALGRFCGDVLDPRGRGGVRPCDDDCPILHARFRGGARATEHLRLPSGGVRTVVITSAAAAADTGLSGEAMDETRQFQVIRDETEVEATRRLRDAVLANISHEFRTPLTAQLASIELLRDRLAGAGPEGAGALVQALERGTLRLTQLIDNLLESVRIEAGEHTLRRRPVALDEVVQEATALTSPLIEQRGQQLAVDLPYPFPQVTGDGPRLTQVFVNLLANANKFAPPGSTIRIGGAVGEREVTLWVEDEGPGLGSAAASLFQPFVRSADPDAEEEPEQGGIGLGLWIVKSIVERHGGRVEARPAGRPAGIPGDAATEGAEGHGEELRGPGTRMCVVLPVDRDDEAARR